MAVNKRAPNRGARSGGGSRGSSDRKAKTRQALLDAALARFEEKGFTAVSLRQVTHDVGVVPAAFYRHFDSMEELGLALIEDAFRTLREMLRTARTQGVSADHAIRQSVEILANHVREHRAQMRFVARERASGSGVIRRAIGAEMRLLSAELATDLSRFPNLRDWSTEDLQIFATLMVDAMVTIAEAIADAPADDSKAEAEIVRLAEKRLRMMVLGVPNWRSG